MNLSDFDAGVDATRAHPDAKIFNGIYTLEFPSGEHRTFRIHTKRAKSKFAAGQRVISILIGPDNSSDYDMFGFVSDDGIKVWKRHVGSKLDQYAMIIWSLVTGEAIEGYSLEISKRCMKCGRLLTDPESLRTGYGPHCRGA